MKPHHSSVHDTKNDFLEAVCNSLQEGAAVISEPDGRIVFCNQAWLSLFGLIGHVDMELQDLGILRKDSLTNSVWQTRLKTAKDRGIFRERVEYISKHGHTFWAESSIRSFSKNNINYFMVVIDKIDQLKQSELKIAQDKQRFMALLEHASMGILETNQRGEIIDINLSALKLFGYEKKEVLNKKIEMLIPARFHSKHEEHRNQYLHHPNNRPMGLGMDLFAVKKSGEEFPVEVSLTNYMLNDESYVVAFISDITIRKKNEVEIKKLNDELEEIVELRTRELKYAIRQLEISREELYRSLEKEKELSELKSRFVSMASHEFRTPLSTVLSSAYLLEQYTTGADSTKQQKHIQRIVSSVNMLTDILNDFLSVGKIEEGKIHVKYQKFDIYKLMLSAIDEIRVSLKKEQYIQYEHTGDAEVILDISLFRHIIMNLISNASKFSPPTGSINVLTSHEDGLLKLSVEDHGTGISPEDQQHLTERFFRGRNAINIQGTGLGLHIVSKYAELMNGSIKCDSVLHQGTIFTLSFNQQNTTYEEDPVN
ncbi:MAG TPA: PAS domain-containing sensor histidine kinase [Chitinophagaceae bacterium]|nr:PAS domain-containing sensor histidine kinase [Chitinophagaceae bacterium]